MGRYDFSSFIDFAMYLDIIISRCIENTLNPEKPKQSLHFGTEGIHERFLVQNSKAFLSMQSFSSRIPLLIVSLPLYAAQ